jgi:hypothetical protein
MIRVGQQAVSAAALTDRVGARSSPRLSSRLDESEEPDLVAFYCSAIKAGISEPSGRLPVLAIVFRFRPRRRRGLGHVERREAVSLSSLSARRCMASVKRAVGM